MTIVSGPPLADLAELELVWCLQAESDLFLRYRTRPDPGRDARRDAGG